MVTPWGNRGEDHGVWGLEHGVTPSLPHLPHVTPSFFLSLTPVDFLLHLFFPWGIWGTRGGSAGFAWGNPWGHPWVTHGVTLQITRDAARQVRVRKPSEDLSVAPMSGAVDGEPR